MSAPDSTPPSQPQPAPTVVAAAPPVAALVRAPSRAHLTEQFYATRPTRFTLFLRTFLPWQLVRFVAINLKMLRIIWRSHHGGRGP